MTAAVLTACGEGQQPLGQQQSSPQRQQQEKEPQKLKDIEKSIEEIVKSLDGPAVETEEQKGGGQQSGEQSGSGAQDKGKGAQQGQQGQGQQQGQQGQQGQTQPSQPKDPWKEIGSTVERLHFQWNGFMPDALKKGASVKITDNFSNSLNYLTTVVSTRDKNRTLLAANGLYGCIPDLFSLYRTKMSPEIKRMRYLIRNVILTSGSGDWAQAGRDMGSLKASWTAAKGSLDKEQEQGRGMLDLAVSELEKVVADKNQQLTGIKGRVALADIQSVEKSLEKEAENSGGSGS